MNDQLTKTYRAIRAKYDGISARSALSWARNETRERPKWEWSHDGETAKREVDGFDVELSVRYDEWADTSYLGTFSDRWEPGAISNEGSNTDHAYRWFVPAIPLEEHWRALSALGHSRHDAYTTARSYVLRDMKAARETEAYVITVTASRGGIELGSASIGGYEFAEGDRQRQAEDCVEDYGLLDEALSSARDAVEKITR